MKFGRQEHAGLLPTIWHLALGPQGEGTQDAGAGDGVVLSLVIAKEMIIDDLGKKNYSYSIFLNIGSFLLGTSAILKIYI